MTPGRYRLELRRLSTSFAVEAQDRLTLAAPLTSTGQVDTEEDLRFQALWDGYEYSGDLVLSASPLVHELHWDDVAVHYEPHLIDLFTVPIVPGQIVTVWEGNLMSCPKRQFRLHRLDPVTPTNGDP